MITYQDFVKADQIGDRVGFIEDAIQLFKASDQYSRAKEADEYFAGENRTILSMKSQITVRYGKDEQYSETIEVNKFKIPRNFMKPLIIQQSGTLFNWGLQWL